MKSNMSVWQVPGILVLLSSGRVAHAEESPDAIRQEIDRILSVVYEEGESERRIAKLGKPAVPHLLEMLDEGFKWPATLLHAITLIGDPAALEGLERIYAREEHIYTKDTILRAIGDIGGEKAVSFLRKRATDEKEVRELRMWAKAMLVKLGDEEARAEAREKAEKYFRFVSKLMDPDIDDAEKERITEAYVEFMGPNLPATPQAEIRGFIFLEQFALLGDFEITKKMYVWGHRSAQDTIGYLVEIGTPEALEMLVKIACEDESILPKRGIEKGGVSLGDKLRAIRAVLEKNADVPADVLRRMLLGIMDDVEEARTRNEEQRHKLSLRSSKLNRKIEELEKRVKEYEEKTGEKFDE